MRLLFACITASLLCRGSSFAPLFQQKSSYNSDKQRNPVAALLVGSAILASSLLAGGSASPPPANAVEISSGAFSIETSTAGQAISEAKLDTSALLKALVKNRKQVAASFDRIQTVLKEEFNSPVWNEIKRDVLQLEGDLISDIKISPPSDWVQTVKDLQAGRVNFILNGEIVNVAVDTRIGKDEDELFIRVEGFRGVDLKDITPVSPVDAITNVYASRWQQRFAGFSKLWDKPLGVLPNGSEVKIGPAVTSGVIFTIVTAYAGSYAYYTNEQASAAAEAEAKRKAATTKNKAVAAKKKTQEEES